MASFDVAFRWLMSFEDPAYQYKTVIDNNGAGVICGINAASYPRDFQYIDSLPVDQRRTAVYAFYNREFWNQWFDQMVSDKVAKRVVDACVNMGKVSPIKMLQECVGVEVDGVLGPNTVAKVNACDEATLVNCFKQSRLAHYEAIAAANPADAVYLGTEANPGPWYRRAMA